MALVLKKIPLNQITSVQYSGASGISGVAAGTVEPLVAPVSTLFAKITTDEPFTLDSGTGRESITDPAVPPAASASADPSTSASAAVPPLPGVLGKAAADYTCTKVNR